MVNEGLWDLVKVHMAKFIKPILVKSNQMIDVGILLFVDLSHIR